MRSSARIGWLGLLLVFGMLTPLLLACQSPPQILEISPGKGAVDVPTNAPVRIHFDRPLDRPSVEARFQLLPRVQGEVSWEAPDTLVFRHDTLDPSRRYQVRLDAGYRDQQGSVNSFTHSWFFQTEGPPQVRSTSPAAGETAVDPATYLTFTFSREMNPESFRGAVTLSPSLPFAVEADPADARRVLIAPKSLLDPDSEYQVSVSGDATDADGNHLPPLRFRFLTGPIRPLSQWITFIASENGTATGTGVWMVDDAGFPRNLEETPADAFTWTPDGSNLLVRHPDRTWTDYSFRSAREDLPFHADWAAFLGAGQGFVFLDEGRLSRLLPGGLTLSIADGVEAAAVSHDLGQVAFSQAGQGGADLRAYDVALRAQYRVQKESASIPDLAWSPNGKKLAYLLGTAPLSALRIKDLTGSAAVSTVATGQISDVSWMADSTDVVFSAVVPVAGGQRSRIFRLNTATAPARLAASSAIGPVTDEDAFRPQPSPDGHQIAFLLGGQQNSQVWLMNADGTGADQLTAYDSAAFPYSCQGLRWASS